MGNTSRHIAHKAIIYAVLFAAFLVHEATFSIGHCTMNGTTLVCTSVFRFATMYLPILLAAMASWYRLRTTQNAHVSLATDIAFPLSLHILFHSTLVALLLP